MGLMVYSIPHYLDPRWLSPIAHVDQIINGFIAGHVYWFLELGIISLGIGFLVRFIRKYWVSSVFKTDMNETEIP